MLIARRIAVFALIAAAGNRAHACAAGRAACACGEAVANPPGLPAIGRWMIARDGTIAHWLGEIVDGKRLHEPVNVILIDEGAAAQTMRSGGLPRRRRRPAFRSASGIPPGITASSAACSTASSRRAATTPSPTAFSRKATTTAACSVRTVSTAVTSSSARSAASASISWIGPGTAMRRSTRRVMLSRAASMPIPPSRLRARCRLATPSTMRRLPPATTMATPSCCGLFVASLRFAGIDRECAGCSRGAGFDANQT